MTTSDNKPRKPGTFKKDDPRINRKGRPKSFDAIRAIAREIADETAKSGGRPVVVDGREITVAEAILRKWATSKSAQLQRAFIETAFGKVPDVKHIGSDDGEDIQIILTWADYVDDDDDGDEVET